MSGSHTVVNEGVSECVCAGLSHSELSLLRHCGLTFIS